jgi:hypothetical protein
MRLTPRLIVRLVLVLLVLALFWYRLLPHHGSSTRSAGGDSSASAPLNQPGGGPAPAIGYEIYSSLYQQPAPAPVNEPLVFAQASQTDIPQVGFSCLKPQTPEERQLAKAFNAANSLSHSWQQQFAIPQGYRLLDASQTAQARACLRAHSTSGECSAYKDVRHVRFLGVPGVDPAATHALVSVIKSCGPDCGSGGVFEVEKSGNTWQRSPATDFTRDCSWMY